MKKSIKKNYIYNLIYQVLVIIIPIITIPYVSRVLGASNIGIYGYTLSISAYFILIGSLGIALYGQREIAYVQNDKEAYSKKFWEIFILKFCAISIVTIVYYVIFVRSNQIYSEYFEILLLEIFGNAIDISWFFQGLEEFSKTVSRNIIVKIISLICIFLFVKSENDLYIYFLIYVLSIIIGNLSLWLYIPKFIEKAKLKSLNIFKHLKPTIVLFIPQAAIQIYTVLDRTMIGVIISEKAEVGFYTQGEKIIKLLLTIITAMGTVMLPRIANRFAEKDNESIRIHLYKSFNLVFLLAFPLILGLVSVSKNFVPLFFGAGYSKVILIMIFLSPIIFLIGMSNVIGMQYLLPTKRQKEFTTSVVIGAIVNFFLNLLFIPRFKSLGATFATVIAELSVTLVQFYYVRKDFEFKKILSLSKNYLIASLIMFCNCISIIFLIHNRLWCLIIQIAIGILSYALALIVLKDKFVFNLFNNNIKPLLKRRKCKND